MNVEFCKTCGAPLRRVDAYTWECSYCHNTYGDKSVKEESERLLRTLLREDKLERVANLRRNLYDAINATYTDSKEICRICGELKALLPDDFMANFYYTANHGTPLEVCRAIRETDAGENADQVDMIVGHILKSMRSEYALPLQNLVERAYKNTDMAKFEKLSTSISDEMKKVDESVYETAVPRDIFVAYSSKDMPAVEKLVGYLEENGLECFVAARNLRHGRGSVQNYETALHEAMDNCKCVVFVSSVNSRNMECDALKTELKRIKRLDIDNLPVEYKQNYEQAPYSLKKMRIEYRIDNAPTPPGPARMLGSFFFGLEYVMSPEAVLDRFDELDMASAVKDGTNEASEQPALKYCVSCGAENIPSTKFCCECGSREFVDTYKEYEQAKEISELRARIKAEEERKAAEEARKAEAAGKAAADKVAEDAKHAEELDRIAAALNEEARKRAEKKKALENTFEFKLLSNGTYSVGIKSLDVCPEEIAFPSSYNGKAVTAISQNALKGRWNKTNTAVKSVKIPEGVKNIGNEAFSFCRALASVNIPNSVKIIGNDAFSGCSALASITIPNSVTNIGTSAFCSCRALTSITVPNSVTSIGSEAFADCTALSRITIPNSVTSIGEKAFFMCSSLSTVTFDGTKEEWEKIKKNEARIPSSAAVEFTADSGSVSSGNFVIADNITGKPVDHSRYTLSVDKDTMDTLNRLKAGSEENAGRAEEARKSEAAKKAAADKAAEDAKLSEELGRIAMALNEDARKKAEKKKALDNALEFKLLSNGTYSVGIKSLDVCPEEVIFPSSYNGKAVTVIAENALKGTETKYNTRLRSVTIPEGITEIGNLAFFRCSSLTSVKLPDSVSVIGERAFFSCGSLSGVNIPNGVTSIGSGAFSGCKSISLIAVPASVRSLGSNPFREIPIDRIIVAIRNTVYEKRYNCVWEIATGRLVSGDRTSVITNKIKEIGNEAFAGSNISGNVTVPQSVTKIGDYAFNACKSLTGINIPDSVTEIGRGAFHSCTSLTSVRLPGKLPYIGDWTFTLCSSLTDITIPKSVKILCNQVFSFCQSLKTITFDGTREEWEKIINDNAAIPKKTGIIFTQKSEDLEKAELFDFTELEDGTYSVGIRSRDVCPKEVVFPSSYKGKAVTAISQKALRGEDWEPNTVVKRVTIPDGVTSIGSGAFFNCRYLKSVTVPDSVKSIGEHAFYRCTSLGSITLPDSVTSIGKDAFMSSGLCSITIPGGIKDIGEGAFSNCLLIRNITIPGSVTSIGERAFRSCSHLTDVVISNGVTSIGDMAFACCESLTNITIPNTVTSIGGIAFLGCVSLRNITFNGTKKEWKAIEKSSYYADKEELQQMLKLSGLINTLKGRESFTVSCTDGTIPRMFSWKTAKKEY